MYSAFGTVRQRKMKNLESIERVQHKVSLNRSANDPPMAASVHDSCTAMRSSRSSIPGCCRSARVSKMLCRYPPNSCNPFSPMGESRPSGSDATKSYPDAAAAAAAVAKAARYQLPFEQPGAKLRSDRRRTPPTCHPQLRPAPRTASVLVQARQKLSAAPQAFQLRRCVRSPVASSVSQK